MILPPFLRLIPPVALVVLVIAKLAKPDFLAGHVWITPIPWFVVVFFALLWLSAWVLTPYFAVLVAKMAARGFVWPVIFTIVILGLLAVVDIIWNHTIHALGGPEAHVLSYITTAIFGGN